MDPYQALISTASYQSTFDRTGALLSGYDLMGGAGPTFRSFQYGVDGMPSRINYGSTRVYSYYDDTGTRVLKLGTQVTVYVGPHFEVRGGVRHRYVFANGIRVALLTPSDTYYFHGDHLGSTRAITNGAGTAVWTGSYEPFGRLSSETGSRVSPYLFTGQELDGETGLYYFGARYYDPSTGMFTSADSILARPYDPQSLNRYAYVGGKPLSRFDPDGHNWWGDFTNWVGKGLNWLGEHSDGGVVVPIVPSGSGTSYRTYVGLTGPTMGDLMGTSGLEYDRLPNRIPVDQPYGMSSLYPRSGWKAYPTWRPMTDSEFLRSLWANIRFAKSANDSALSLTNWTTVGVASKAGNEAVSSYLKVGAREASELLPASRLAQGAMGWPGRLVQLGAGAILVDYSFEVGTYVGSVPSGFLMTVLEGAAVNTGGYHLVCQSGVQCQ